MKRSSKIERKTKETDINLILKIEGNGESDISTGIPFFDHMLSLFSAHGFFDLIVKAKGDLEVDFHHTVEDLGLVLGKALDKALGDRKGIRRYGHAVTPMDDALSSVTIDLSKRPFLVFNTHKPPGPSGDFDLTLAKEFFRAFSNMSGMNLHINVSYGENEHHIIESIFKALGRSLNQAVSFDDRVTGVLSTKGSL